MDADDHRARFRGQKAGDCARKLALLCFIEDVEEGANTDSGHVSVQRVERRQLRKLGRQRVGLCVKWMNDLKEARIECISGEERDRVCLWGCVEELVA